MGVVRCQADAPYVWSGESSDRDLVVSLCDPVTSETLQKKLPWNSCVDQGKDLGCERSSRVYHVGRLHRTMEQQTNARYE